MRDIALLIPTWLPLCLLLLALALPLQQLLFPQPPAATPRASAFPVASLGLLLAILSILAVLLSLWASGRSHPNLIGGSLPWNDAAGYFHGANALLDSGELTSWSQRRPIYTSLLAGFLALSGRDLQIALLLQGALVGAVAFFTARVATRQMGVVAGLLVFALLFSFAHEYAPITMTENAGFLFGALGIAFLWMAIEKKHAGWFAVAGLLLMTGLMARAGAFLVIPFLFLAIGIAFRHQRRTAITCALGFLAGVLLAVLLNQAIYWYAGSSVNMPFSNFSYTLYGLAVGGKGWQQIYTDYPAIFQSGEGIASQKIYMLAFEHMLETPLDFVIGYVKGLPHTAQVLFGFVPYSLPVPKPFAIFFILLWLTGLWVAFHNRRQPHALFLLAATAGAVLSSPFLADVDSRIYAATIPFDAFLVCLGFSTIAAWRMRKQKRKPPIPAATPGLSAQLIGMAGILLALTLAGTFLFPKLKAEALPGLTCGKAEIPIVLRLGSESPLVALRANPPLTFFPPQPRHQDFTTLLRPDVHLWEKLKQLPPETILIEGYEKQRKGHGGSAWIAWQTEDLPPRGSLVGFCLKPGPHPLLGPVFHEPESVRVLE